MVNLPKIKKKVSSFIRSEEGKISKQSLLAMGAFLGTAAFSFLALAKAAKAGFGGGPCDDCGPFCGSNAGEFGRGPISSAVGEYACTAPNALVCCTDDAIFHGNTITFYYDADENKAVAGHGHELKHNSY